MYDELKLRKDTLLLFFDIKELTKINNISRSLGDKVIVKALKRIEKYATDDMILFRTGGDEFALVTGLNDIDDAKKLAEKIVSENGEGIELNGNKCTLSLRVGCIKLEQNLMNYKDLFSRLNESITRDKTLSGF